MISPLPSANAFQRGMMNSSAVSSTVGSRVSNRAAGSFLASHAFSTPGAYEPLAAPSIWLSRKASASGNNTSQRSRASSSFIVHPPRPPP